MKKYFFIFLSLTLLFACKSNDNDLVFKHEFSLEEQKVLQMADTIIKTAYYCTLITLDNQNQPRARIVEPFLPEKDYTIWIATNPKSRKVKQLKNNTAATLHYFDKNSLAYVSLMGNAFLVNDETIKAQKFKDGWDKFYPNKKEDYLLIKFVPKIVELISVNNQYPGDSISWKPHQVILRK